MPATLSIGDMKILFQIKSEIYMRPNVSIRAGRPVSRFVYETPSPVVYATDRSKAVVQV